MRISTLLVLSVIVISAAGNGWAQTRAEASGIEFTDLSKSVQVFPNPTVDYVHLKVDAVSVHNLHITLHNIIGNEVTAETEILNDHEIRVRVKDLTSGYYLLAVKDNESRFKGIYKFLKK